MVCSVWSTRWVKLCIPKLKWTYKFDKLLWNGRILDMEITLYCVKTWIWAMNIKYMVPFRIQFENHVMLITVLDWYTVSLFKCWSLWITLMHYAHAVHIYAIWKFKETCNLITILLIVYVYLFFNDINNLLKSLFSSQKAHKKLNLG